MIRSPGNFGCLGDALCHGLRSMFERWLGRDLCDRLGDLGKVASELAKSGTVIGNGYFGPLGGEVLNRASHQGHLAFEPGKSLGGWVDIAIQSCARYPLWLGFIVRLEIKFNVIGFLHLTSP